MSGDLTKPCGGQDIKVHGSCAFIASMNEAIQKAGGTVDEAMMEWPLWRITAALGQNGIRVVSVRHEYKANIEEEEDWQDLTVDQVTGLYEDLEKLCLQHNISLITLRHLFKKHGLRHLFGW